MEIETRPSLIPGVNDILMHVGLIYDVPQYLSEAESEGFSKRISINSIPEGVAPGRSNLFVWHSHAIPMVKSTEHTMVDLVAELQSLGKLDPDFDPEDFDWNPVDWLLPDDFVPPGTLQVTCAIQGDKKLRAELEAKYKIKWHAGVIAYSPLGKLRYILKKGETELPEHLRPFAHMIDAVRVIRVDDEGNPLEDQGGECEQCELDDEE